MWDRELHAHPQRRGVLLVDRSVLCERDSEWVPLALAFAISIGLIVLAIRQLAKICRGFNEK